MGFFYYRRSTVIQKSEDADILRRCRIVRTRERKCFAVLANCCFFFILCFCSGFCCFRTGTAAAGRCGSTTIIWNCSVRSGDFGRIGSNWDFWPLQSGGKCTDFCAVWFLYADGEQILEPEFFSYGILQFWN